MVRFEPGKLVVEIPTGDTYHEYLMILHALSTIGWFAAEHDEDDSIRNAYGILSFYIGQSLTKMSETDLNKLNQAATR